jgi:predicted amidohydrolase
MDLAAMLAQSEQAAEQGVQVLVFPRVPGIGGERSLLEAFFRNVEERAPGMAWISPMSPSPGEEPGAPSPTALGRTLALDGDDCIDPAHFARIQESGCDTLVWRFNAEDPLQAEAALELALDASLHLAPLVIVASITGSIRGIHASGISAIVQLGEILVEGGSGDELLVADVRSLGGFPERPRTLPEPAPLLLQRLAVHRSVAPK